MSKGAIANLRKMYEKQCEIGIKYKQMKEMNLMWQQYIKLLFDQIVYYKPPEGGGLKGKKGHQETSRSIYKNEINKMERISSSDKTDFVMDSTKMDSISAKIVKADFNGAVLEIIKCKNAQMIGQKGIVAKETQRTFVIIDENDKQKIFLKSDTVFRIQLPYINLHNERIHVDLWGDMLTHKGSERTKTKYKERGCLTLYY